MSPHDPSTEAFTMLRKILGTACVPILAALALKFLPIPFAWIFFGAFAVFTWIFVASSPKRPLWYYCALVVLAVAGLETYLGITDIHSARRQENHTGISYIVPHDVLGYAPLPEASAAVAEYYGDEVVYEVSYQFDARGLRVTPPAAPDEDAACIAFFGGSFTFGEGLEDDETLPSAVAAATDGEYHVCNFGLSGYGAHQMLAALENGLVVGVGCRIKYAIYQGMLPHVTRALGKNSWDKHTPRYEQNAEGVAVQRGHHDDGSWFVEKFRAQLLKSEIVKRSTGVDYRDVTLDDVALYVAIVDKSRAIIEEAFPGSEFHVLFWDEAGVAGSEAILESMARAGIRVHRLSEVLSGAGKFTFGSFGLEVGAGDEWLKYVVSQYNGHPSALTNALIGHYVTDQIVHEGPRGDDG
jgi:hypothetical protein